MICCGQSKCARCSVFDLCRAWISSTHNGAFKSASELRCIYSILFLNVSLHCQGVLLQCWIYTIHFYYSFRQFFERFLSGFMFHQIQTCTLTYRESIKFQYNHSLLRNHMTQIIVGFAKYSTSLRVLFILYRVFRNYSFELIQEVENLKIHIFRYGTYGPRRQFLMLGTALHRRQFSMLITAVDFTGTARMRDHWPVCNMHAVHRRTIDCRVVRRFLTCPQWYDGNSSDKSFFCLHKGFTHLVT